MVREGRRAFRHGRDAVAAVIARHDWAAPLVRILRGIWTDGYVVGTLSAQAVLAHHGITKADTDVATVTLGVDWGQWSPGDAEAAREILGRSDALDHLLSLVDTGDTVADKIVVSRMDRLAGTLIDGLEKGLSPDAIAKRLEPILHDPAWAHLVSLTETTRAVSSATLASYARNGVEAKEWMTALDQRVCALCQGNEDDGVIPLGEAFGTGDQAPPAHPLCRCSIAPAWTTPTETATQAGPGLTGLGAEELAQVATRSVEEILGEEEPVTVEAAGEETTYALPPVPAEAAPGAAEAAGAAGPAPATAIEIRPSLQAAQSTIAVGQRFEQEAFSITGRHIPAEFRGSLQTAREHAEGLLRGLERFPEADLVRVESMAFEDSSAFAHADGGVIRFNSAWTTGAKRQDYLDVLAKDVESHWSPAGMDNPAAVALHEFGHILDIETLGEVAQPEIERVIEETAASFGLSEEFLVQFDVSRYAAEAGVREVAAEAFTDVMVNGTGASQLSRDIYAEIRKAYEAGGRELRSTVAARGVAPKVADLSSMTVKDLRALAKERGLTGYSKLTKPQLLERLKAAEPKAAAVVEDLSKKTVADLRALAKERGLKGYSKLTKPQLLERLQTTTAPAERSAAERVAAGDFSGMKKVGGQLGGNLGGTYEAPDGSRWYIKVAKDENAARSEALALALYRAAGLDAPEMFVGAGADLSGGVQVATRIIPDTRVDLLQRLSDTAYVDKVREGFAVDAWLANWDVVGANPAGGWDNIVSVGDTPIRIEAGGALRYKGLGGLKGAKFGDVVDEWDSLRTASRAGKIFGGITDEQIKASAARVEAITPEQIRALVKQYKLDSKLADRLIARRADLLRRAEELDRKAAEAADAARRNAEGAKRWGKASKGARDGDAALRTPKVKLNDRNELTGLPAGLNYAEERNALVAYRGTSYVDINGILRGKELKRWTRDEVTDWVRAIDRTMSDSPLSSNVIGWRGMATGTGVFGERATWGALTGRSWVEDGYLSISTERRTAENGFVGYGKGVIMRVLVPKGTGAIKLSGADDAVGESEILVERGARLDVVADHGDDAQGRRILDVIVVPPDSTPAVP